MTQDDVQRLVTRYNVATNEALNFRSLFETAFQYAMPNRNIYTNDSPGSDRNSTVYDTTLPRAVNIFVSKVLMGLTPPGKMWASFVAGDDVPIQSVSQVNKDLETVSQVLFRYLYTSNFLLAISESYYDLAAGTMALLINPGPNAANPLIFKSVPLKYIAPEEGPFGKVESNWRKAKGVAGRDIMRIWPKATLPASLVEDMAKNPNGKYDFIEGALYIEEGKYRYVVIYEPESYIIYEDEFKSTPWVIGRWRVAGEVFGRGPIIDALPSALSLNKIAEFEFKTAALAIAPPYMSYTDQLFDPTSFNIEPNKVIAINRSTSPSWPIQKLDAGGDIKFGQILANDLRAQINAFLYTDPLGPINSPVTTATEANIRDAQLLQEVGPSIGRMEVEVLAPILKRVFHILQSFDILPRDLSVDGKAITIEYQSKLARSQDLEDLNALDKANQILQSIAGPQSSQVAYKAAQLPEFIFSKAGAPLALIKTPEELIQEAARTLAQKEQQDEQDRQAAVAASPSPVVPNTAPPPQTNTGIVQ